MKSQLEKFTIDFSDPKYAGMPKSRVKKLAKKEYWERNKALYKKLKREEKKAKKAKDPKPQSPAPPVDENMNKPNKKTVIKMIREKQKTAPVIVIDVAFEDKSDEKVSL